MVYKWKGRGYGVKAEVVGKELEKLKKKNGDVTARAFVDAARSEKSPLHKLLEWDDKKAAEKYRLSQATEIICHLAIECEDMEEPITVRAYMNVADDADNPTRRTGSFIDTQSAFENEETRGLILRCAIRELTEIRQKYANLQELATIFEAIDKVAEVKNEETV